MCALRNAQTTVRQECYGSTTLRKNTSGRGRVGSSLPLGGGLSGISVPTAVTGRIPSPSLQTACLPCIRRKDSYQHDAAQCHGEFFPGKGIEPVAA